MNEMVVEHTGQQINDYCEKVLNLCLTCRNEGSLMFESVQIIRQLQAELNKKVSIDLGADKFYD